MLSYKARLRLIWNWSDRNVLHKAGFVKNERASVEFCFFWFVWVVLVVVKCIMENTSKVYWKQAENNCWDDHCTNPQTTTHTHTRAGILYQRAPSVQPCRWQTPLGSWPCMCTRQSPPDGCSGPPGNTRCRRTQTCNGCSRPAGRHSEILGIGRINDDVKLLYQLYWITFVKILFVKLLYKLYKTHFHIKP